MPKKGQLLPRVRTGGEVRRLVAEGRATEFDMVSQWAQRVRGKLAIEPNGRLRVVEFTPVGDVTPSPDRSE